MNSLYAASWMTIDTAPIGRTVLVWVRMDSTGEDLGHEIAWLEDDGVWERTDHNNPVFTVSHPTHWMPLPIPPSREG